MVNIQQKKLYAVSKNVIFWMRLDGLDVQLTTGAERNDLRDSAHSPKMKNILLFFWICDGSETSKMPSDLGNLYCFSHRLIYFLTIIFYCFIMKRG